MMIHPNKQNPFSNSVNVARSGVDGGIEFEARGIRSRLLFQGSRGHLGKYKHLERVVVVVVVVDVMVEVVVVAVVV